MTRAAALVRELYAIRNRLRRCPTNENVAGVEISAEKASPVCGTLVVLVHDGRMSVCACHWDEPFLTNRGRGFSQSPWGHN